LFGSAFLFSFSFSLKTLIEDIVNDNLLKLKLLWFGVVNLEQGPEGLGVGI
jgi:hypothetical protein